MNKICTQCKETKSVAEFGKHSQKKDGLSSWCKECTRKKNNESNAKYKDKKAEYDKQYRLKNAEKIKLKQATYTSINKEAKAIYDKKYREKQGQERLKNKQDYYHNRGGKEVVYKWAANNAEKVKAYKSKTDAARRSIENNSSMTTTEFTTWLNEQVKFCPYCNTFCENSYHIDHIEPLSKGGKHELDNLTVACPSCNQSKHAKNLIHWYAIKTTDRSKG